MQKTTTPSSPLRALPHGHRCPEARGGEVHRLLGRRRYRGRRDRRRNRVKCLGYGYGYGYGLRIRRLRLWLRLPRLQLCYGYPAYSYGYGYPAHTAMPTRRSCTARTTRRAATTHAGTIATDPCRRRDQVGGKFKLGGRRRWSAAATGWSPSVALRIIPIRKVCNLSDHALTAKGRSVRLQAGRFLHNSLPSQDVFANERAEGIACGRDRKYHLAGPAAP